MAGLERLEPETRDAAAVAFDEPDAPCAEACEPEEGSCSPTSCPGERDDESREEGADAAPASRSARVRKAASAWLRHPLRSTRNALDVCSVRAAFFFYALIGMAAAFVLSLGAISPH